MAATAKPQLKKSRRGFSLPAGASSSQATFIKAMNLKTPEDIEEMMDIDDEKGRAFLTDLGVLSDFEVPEGRVISADLADVLSMALSHVRIEGETLNDPYFTLAEWAATSNLRSTIIAEAEILLFDQDTTAEAKKKWKERAAPANRPICKCKAHSDDTLYTGFVFNSTTTGR